MIHFALPSRSVHSDKPYTTPGLGDRIHSATLAWCYSQGDPITLHVTGEQYSGGQFGNKPESWAEISGLFPNLTIEAHRLTGLSNAEWYRHTQARPYWYGDFPGQYEQKQDLDISVYLKDIPRLTPKRRAIELPAEYITVQWDTSAGRTIPNPKRIEDKYGLPVITIGGQAHDHNLRWSLQHIAYTLSRAHAHVGADSGFMHLAMLYLPMEQIHIYTRSQSHHVKRAVANGAKLNPYA